MLHSRLLHYLDEVARTGSMRKASTRLNVASSAINRQILALEAELGTPLFLRLPRKLMLTAAGELVIRHVRQTLKEMDRVQRRIEELKGLRRGEITLAIMSGLAANMVPRIAVEFRRTSPRVKLTLRLLPSGHEIMAAVSAGEADLGLGFDFPREPGLRVLASGIGRLGAVMAPDHPLAGRHQLRLSDCVDYPLIIAEEGMAIRPYLNEALAASSLQVEPTLETNSIEVMRHAAMLDQAITFLTPFDIEWERRAGRLAYVPVHELHGRLQTLMLIGRDRGVDALTSLMAEQIRTAILATSGG
ncbi:LysR family transcriptional regulator [Acidisoma sp. 7E03]